MTSVMVIAPHPDDETLGCGGTLLRHKAAGEAVAWLVVTSINEDAGYEAAEVAARAREIEAVADAYAFDSVHDLGLPATRLDALPLRDIVGELGRVIGEVAPDTLYLPYPGDVHSDHRVVFEAAAACTKWFRYPSVRRVLVYETPSETDFAIDPGAFPFRPNVFIDVTAHVERKIEIMALYASETGEFPFPRSAEAVRALTRLRGSQAGCPAAEALMLLREIR